jgi:hypothetical protein
MFLSVESGKVVEIFGMTGNFWVVVVVFAMLLTAILTAAYNDDKTKGL